MQVAAKMDGAGWFEDVLEAARRLIRQSAIMGAAAKIRGQRSGC